MCAGARGRGGGGARPTAARPCRARTGQPACRSAVPTRPGSRSRVPHRQYLGTMRTLMCAHDEQSLDNVEVLYYLVPKYS